MNRLTFGPVLLAVATQRKKETIEVSLWEVQQQQYHLGTLEVNVFCTFNFFKFVQHPCVSWNTNAKQKRGAIADDLNPKLTPTKN